MAEPSLFTKIINGDIPSSKVASSDKYYAFLDINPRREGHTLVVPKEQQQYIAQLSQGSRAALLDGVAEVQRRLTAVFGTTDFTVAVHDGPLAGQEVPHVHFHVIPRTKDDGGLTLLAQWPNTPEPGKVPPDFAKLGELAKKLQDVAAPEKKGKKEGQPKAQPKKDGKKGGYAAEEPPKPKTPEELAEERKKKMKKVIKEGGKRGVEIEGAADMGGLGYFCTSMDEPEGDLEMLQESMKAMNAESDPTEEERKGGSGRIGKMLFSAGPDQLGIISYVPADKTGECDASEWLKHVLGMFQGEFVSGDKGLAIGKIAQDPNKNIFALKLKEPGITEAISYLKKRELFPDKDDSDDDMVFGDDDFPE